MAKAEGWANVLPKAILDGISFNGKVYLAPVNITSMNRLYYNIALLKNGYRLTLVKGFLSSGFEEPVKRFFLQQAYSRLTPTK